LVYSLLTEVEEPEVPPKCLQLIFSSFKLKSSMRRTLKQVPLFQPKSIACSTSPEKIAIPIMLLKEFECGKFYDYNGL